MKKNILQLTGSILICELAGIIGSVFTFSAIPTWYATLNKPSFSPPSWVFGPAWTTLYALMGVALFLVWKSAGHGKGENNASARSSKNTVDLRNHKKRAITVFFIQLLLNASWSPVFFGLRSPSLAFAIIILLWLSIVLTMIKFRKISKAAFWLLVPYILWVSFASVLNFSIWQLNS